MDMGKGPIPADGLSDAGLAGSLTAETNSGYSVHGGASRARQLDLASSSEPLVWFVH